MDGADGKRTIVPDPNLAPILKRMFEWYATGKYSLKQLAQMARAEGLVYRKSGDPVPVSTVHKMLRNRIYSGDFDFDGATYRGAYQPIVSRELWEEVQGRLDGRGTKKTRRVKDQFAFSGLVTCGHCGCALVGEEKKGRYIYYHCTGYKGKCPEPYTRAEVLAKEFTRLLKGISFSDEVLAWVTQALRESHRDERRFHEDAIAKLQHEHRRIQDRIDVEFFDRKAAEFRAEQCRIMRDIDAHQSANQSYVEEGIRLLELAHNAHRLFENQPPAEERKRLDFVVSNCTWKDGELRAEYRQPFDVLALAVAADEGAKEVGATISAKNEIWLPGEDSNHDSRLQRPLSCHWTTGEWRGRDPPTASVAEGGLPVGAGRAVQPGFVGAAAQVEDAGLGLVDDRRCIRRSPCAGVARGAEPVFEGVLAGDGFSSGGFGAGAAAGVAAIGVGLFVGGHEKWKSGRRKPNWGPAAQEPGLR